jgi:hypothetical protein
MESINVAPELVACCGLYCAACRKYVAGKCPGCRAHNEKHWCKVLACCRQKGFETCAECTSPGSGNCKTFNSPIANVFQLLFRSDRQACIARIREIGKEAFAREMALAGKQVIKRS